MHRETLGQVALVLVCVGLGFQMVDAWRILSSGTASLVPFVLTHAGVALMFGGVLWKTHRGQPVVSVEVYVLAAIVGGSWAADLGLLLMTAAR
jgi:hypothetical protein